MKLSDCFERAFIVNLPERADRRRETEAELRNVQLDRPGWASFFPALRPSDAQGFPSCAALGCFLSHLEILKRAHADKLANVLVMEDDVAFFSDRMQAHEEAAAQWLTQHPWHWAYVGHELQIAAEGPWEPYAEKVPLAHCYAITSELLPELIDYLEAVLRRPPGHPDGGSMHVDGAYSMFRARRPDLITVVAAPSLATQRSSRSDIHPHWYDKIPGAVRMMGSARRLLRAGGWRGRERYTE